MTKLKLGAIEADKPVRLSIEVSAVLHRDLLAYAEALALETGQSNVDPSKLIVPMLVRFMATDRAFAKAKQKTQKALGIPRLQSNEN